MPSALDEQLNTLRSTNNPPDNADLPTVLAGLESSQSHTARLINWILVLEASLARVREAKAAVESSIRLYAGVLLLIYSIPVDLLRVVCG